MIVHNLKANFLQECSEPHRKPTRTSCHFGDPGTALICFAFSCQNESFASVRCHSSFTYQYASLSGFCYAGMVLERVLPIVQSAQCTKGNVRKPNDRRVDEWFCCHVSACFQVSCLLVLDFMSGLPSGWTHVKPGAVKDDLYKVYPWLANANPQVRNQNIFHSKLFDGHGRHANTRTSLYFLELGALSWASDCEGPSLLQAVCFSEGSSLQ